MISSFHVQTQSRPWFVKHFFWFDAHPSGVWCDRQKNPASGEDGTYLVDWFDRDEKDRGLERERAATFLNSVVPLIAMWETT